MVRSSPFDEILAVCGGHPLIRGVAAAERGPGWCDEDGRAVALLRRNTDGRIRRLLAVGVPDAVARLLTGLRGELPPRTPVTVPYGTPLPVDDPVVWHFRAAFEPPRPRPAEAAVAWRADDAAIAELLRLTGSGWTTWPGDGKARRWAGVVDGRLLACLADTTAAPGVGAIAAVAVRPGARGRSLGSSITAWAMRRMFEEGCDAVTLGVFPHNEVAVRMYDRLGFTLDEPRVSGILPP